MRVTRFLAVGDSFTEGMCDDVDGAHYRGWADRVAEALASAAPDLAYANLAVRGKLLDQVVVEQLARSGVRVLLFTAVTRTGGSGRTSDRLAHRFGRFNDGGRPAAPGPRGASAGRCWRAGAARRHRPTPPRRDGRVVAGATVAGDTRVAKRPTATPLATGRDGVPRVS